MKTFQRALDSQMCIGKLLLNLYLGYCLCISPSINNYYRFYFSVVLLFNRRLLNEQCALWYTVCYRYTGRKTETQLRGCLNGLCWLWQKLLAAYTGNQLQWAAESVTHCSLTEFLYIQHFQIFIPAASLAPISFSKMLMPETDETVPNQSHPSRLCICSPVEIARHWILQFSSNFIISTALIGRIPYRLKSLGLPF